ncbi:MAG: signal peptide peptidase SppA [Gammaproteobacteria bacterium]|nr:signal peptide peptidase SppA [Gammaproteobacteria bacterium]
MTEGPGFLRRLLSGFWRGLTQARLIVFNLLFLLMLVVIVLVFTGGAPEPLPKKAALVLNPAGNIVEQKSYVDPYALLLDRRDPNDREVLLRDVLDAIAYAKDDPGITSLVMELDKLNSVGISKSGEIITALEDFRSSGKPMIARGENFSQGQYLLAAQADTIILHPFGSVQIEGFSTYRMYMKEALDKLSLSMHVFRAGEHKSFVEPFLRSDMSPTEKEINGRWLGHLWSTYTDMVEQRRQLPAGALQQYIAGYSEALRAAGGNMAQMALDQGLVDRLEARREANQSLVEVVGESNKKGRYQGVGFERYLAHKRPLLETPKGSSRVGVITARGTIREGDQPAGSIGADSLAALVGRALDDDGVKALVLRVDSGGGGVFASEVIRRKLLEAKDKGKPIVVSMGSVAASGGYWIALPADEIWATPTTITGSIGVFAAFPTVERLINRFGLYVDGVGTTEMAGAFRADRPLNPQLADMLQANVDSLYQRFVGLVAEGRDLAPADVEALAGGRVWSGYDALELGLVDHLGGLDQAVAAAAELAELEEYEVDYIEQQLSPQEMLVRQLLGQVQAWGWINSAAWQAGLTRWLVPLQASLDMIAEMDDPRGIYARCNLCVAL